MGRVYEALKRAAENGATAKGEPRAAAAADSAGEPRPGGANGNGHAEKIFHAPEDAATAAATFSPAHTSASIEHTGTAFVGSALSGAQASRVAGATVDAVGSARAAEFPSVEISSARVEPHLVAITDPRSPHAEQYRSLRTRVLHAGERRKLQALVITSAGVAEGKTITAINLAWLLAQTDGVSAILVDGDLRNPCAADYLGVEASVGLSEVLAGEATLDETIVKLEPAGLHLLPGGSTRDTVAEILSGPKFSSVLEELRRTFDYVIIDAPPLGIFTDATVLINRADSALVVVRSGKTRFATLDRVLEPLPRERILGVVLNGSDETPGESNYYYQRRYYRNRDAETKGSEDDG
ncbi:MAG TPA: CpsD/CapB family tyrosine-protein kinase [Pyrinomonadaceae bacterium]|jgi:capsular exopolysaccharide synthesis family protein|nr:CpsD/CapB family tyrosine-protein kinase [Pyrinomonadaceae bacterium]